jgi:hypothetical protein
MIDHDFTGDNFVVGEYGQYREAQCGTRCDFAISKIEGTGDELCFYNRTGDQSCVKTDGCSFEGSVQAYSNRHISAITLEINGNPKSMNMYDNYGTGIGSIDSSCALNGGVSYPKNGGKIISIIIDGPKLKFWDSYEHRGDVGFLEILDDVPPERALEGFRAAPEEAYGLRYNYFDRIFYYDRGTFALSAKSLDYYTCRFLGSFFGFEPVEDTQIEKSEELDQLLKNYLGASFNGNLTGGTFPKTAMCFGETGWFNGSKYVFYSPNISYDAATDMCHQELKGSRDECWVNWKDDCHQDGEWVMLELLDDDKRNFKISIAGSVFWFSVNNDCTYFGNPVMYAPGCGLREGAKTDSADPTHSYLFDQSSSGWHKLVLDPREIIIDEVNVQRPECDAGYVSRDGMTCYMPADEQRCVLYRNDDRSFEAAEYARKILEDYSAYTRYFCSPYVCPDHTCQVADCETGYTGSLINDDLKSAAPGECIAQRCDANTPHYEFCGKYQGCPQHIEGIVEDASGKCVRTICNEGGYNPEDKQCYKWQCPLGTTQSGDQCVKN